MAIIPRRLFVDVEWHLHHRAELVDLATQRLREVEASATTVSERKMDGMPKGKGGYSDPTSKNALRLEEAQQGVSDAHKWLRVIQATYDYFTGNTITEIANAYYGTGKTMLAVAEQLFYDRQTVKRGRNYFVCVCALYACELGLIKTDILEREENTNV